MNIDTGRVYLPDEYERRLKAEEERKKFDERQAQFEADRAEGKIVEVSERVALAQLAGQAQEARKRLRKAQKAARKRNR